MNGWLKKIREQRKLSQEKLGEELGVTKMTVSRWEAGKREPDIDTLRRAARVLRCHWVELVGEAPPPSAEEIELLETYRQLDPQTQDVIRRVIEASRGAGEKTTNAA